jgi:putative SOS response-associated peptidase YedK
VRPLSGSTDGAFKLARSYAADQMRKGPSKKNGDTVEQEVFAFMTTEPNELTVSINHAMMPVLLSDPADFETWLAGSTDEAFKLARRALLIRIGQGPADRVNEVAGDAAGDWYSTWGKGVVR